jgi:hypothetical protein
MTRTVQRLRLALCEELNRVGVSLCLSLHLRTEADPVPETLCFLVFGIPDGGRNPETQ